MKNRCRRLTGSALALAVALFSTGQALAQSCTEEAGVEDANIYVEQCLDVSLATHPPCNADNACQLIWDEISRSCPLLGADAPAFCEDYAD